MVQAIKVHGDDDVATVIAPVEKGEAVCWQQKDGEPQTVAAAQAIPRYHKIALRQIPRGGRVRKYGQTIGVATEDIPTGAWVHTHNLVSPGEEGEER